MSEQIKSLADEIRQKLRAEQPSGTSAQGTGGDVPLQAVQSSSGPEANPIVASKQAQPFSINYTEAQVTKFFQQLEGFAYSGEQKSMIRVDARTMKLLRHLKLVRGVEMNKVIVFALHQMLARHPWLVNYIQDSLKNPDL